MGDEQRAPAPAEKPQPLTLLIRQVDTYRAAEVALHELTHAATQAVCRLGDVEAWVKSMAAGLAQVFFDNPEVARWIFKDGDDG